MTRAPFLLALLLVLPACSPAEETADNGQASSGEPADPAGTGALPLDNATPVKGPGEAQLALLDARECRVVAEGYAGAIAARDFAFAARFWNDPVVDAARLEALFAGYRQPRFAIAEVAEEGAAGSLYCTVSGTLSDGADTAGPSRQGEIVLRRVNDVPGATSEQLRWHVERSSLVEEMRRSGRGAPA